MNPREDMLARLLLILPALVAAQLPGTAGDRLQVSENRRFLVHEDGQPFFHLGDTAWELFHRLNREEAARYLDNRAPCSRASRMTR